MSNWSNYQANIFNFVQNGTGNAVIQAVAGSGKSTTIVEAMNRIPASKTAIFLAFNKAIAEELRSRGVNARTFHSLTYMPVTQFKKVRNVEMSKLRILARDNMSGNDESLYSSFCQRLVGLAKQVGMGFLTQDIESNWMDIVDHHQLELDSEGADLYRAVELSRKLLQWSNESSLIDFDDMLFLAVKEGLVLPKFDFVFVDEAQDTNQIQRALLRKILKPTSRIVAVGDSAQAIYGFRGADSDSLNLIRDEFNCIELPLTVSYRCPTSVVKLAQQWVPSIESAPGAAEGTVATLGEWNTNILAANDLVVCRTTRPLISLAYRMLRDRQPVRIMGREIGQGLIKLVEQMRARGIDALITKLGAWSERECEKARAKQNDGLVQSIQDRADSIICIAESLPETERTVPGLIAVINTLFSDVANATVLATIHKSKGLEANNVFWLNSSQCPSKWAKQPWQVAQETNLMYVAVTRAKKTLIMIEDKGML